MRVFVLNTGRCGSSTFADACQTISNYTSGHETRVDLFRDRVAYPDQHVEVDNRLSFFLGDLAAAYPADVFYVHLLRDPEQVARSLAKRWRPQHLTLRQWWRERREPHPYWRWVNMTEAFANGVIHAGPTWDGEQERLEVSRLYVDSTTRNIEHFLRDKPSMTIRLETADASVDEFCDRIGADADRDLFRGLLGERRNAGQPTHR